MPIERSHEVIADKPMEIVLYTGPDIVDNKLPRDERLKKIVALQIEISELSISGLHLLRKHREAELALQCYYAGEQKDVLPICGLPLDIAAFIELLKRASIVYVRGYNEFCLDFEEYAAGIFSEGFPCGVNIDLLTGEETFAECEMGSGMPDPNDGELEEPEELGEGEESEEGEAATDAESAEEEEEENKTEDAAAGEAGVSDGSENNICDGMCAIARAHADGTYHYCVLPWKVYNFQIPKCVRARLIALISNKFVQRIYLMHTAEENPKEHCLVVCCADNRWRLVAFWSTEPLGPLENIVASK